jgi:hypothetical protein
MLTIRFEPDVAFQERFARQLSDISDQATLSEVFMTALRAPSLEALEALMPR